MIVVHVVPCPLWPELGDPVRHVCVDVRSPCAALCDRDRYASPSTTWRPTGSSEGLARLCGYGRPAVPEVLDPESPVRIRRVILEEVSPYDQARRIVHEDVTPYDERTDHAR